MTITEAVVFVFFMMFATITIAVISHYWLEKLRITTGYYNEEKEVKNDSQTT